MKQPFFGLLLPMESIQDSFLDITILIVISYPSMKTTRVIDALGALAHEHRLAIYRLLVQRGPEGLPAGAIGERVGLVPSSLTFHLQNLQRAGLITQQRVSRQLIYSADFDAMSGLIGYLTENCCADSSAECSPNCAPAAKPAKRAAKVA
jgi:ArsR family transcriptional regulator, arsenate/arsenite/antimonite-responsive transcriptional repressor